MRVPRIESDDPVVVGYCVACDHPIYSNEDYYIDQYGAMIHAQGVGAEATITGTETKVNVSCLYLYLQQEHTEDEAAKMFEIERVNA